MSHICDMKISSHFPSDAYMRHKSLFFSYRPRGRPKKPCQAKTHWGRVTHICVCKLTIIASDNDRHQANIWTYDRILLIGTLGTNFSEILSEIHTFSFKKMHWKTSSVKRRPFCLSLNVLIWYILLQYGRRLLPTFPSPRSVSFIDT